MDVNQARKILEEDFPFTGGPKNDIFEGMKLITEIYDGEYVDMSAAHDQIWYGAFEPTVEKMTEDQVRFMGLCGWREAEDSWTTFV